MNLDHGLDRLTCLHHRSGPYPDDRIYFMAINPHEFLAKQRIIFLDCNTKLEALETLVDTMSTSPLVTDPETLLQKIIEREETLSTGVGSGLALPHVKIPSIEDFVVSVGISKPGIEFESLDHKPSHIIVMIGCNETQAGEYVKLLGKFVRCLKSESFRKDILNVEEASEVYDLLTGPEGVH